MAAKKKTKSKRVLTAEDIKKKRSKAAKKGWATRRRNTVKKRASNNQRKLKNAQLGLPPKKRKPNPKISLAGKTKKELLEIARAQEKRLKELERTKDWVDMMPAEYLSRRGHITVQPSLARHDSDFVTMYNRMYDAWEIGEYEFDIEAQDLADEYGYEVREIYTMFFSP